MKVSPKALGAIFRKEVKGYFITPIAYVFIVVYVALLGLLTFVQGRFFEIGEASLTYTFFRWHPWLNAFLVPAIGMRVWTDESKQDTLELLLTHPISLRHLIIFKYLAALVPLLTALLLTMTTVVTVEYLGAPDYGPIFTGYLGSFLIAAAFLAISCCCSSLTRSPVVAFIISCTICIMFLLIGLRQMGSELVGIFPQSRWLVDSIASIGVLQYFDTFQRGLLDFTSIAYFICVIVIASLATHHILAFGQGNGKRKGIGRIPPAATLALMVLVIGVISLLFKQVTIRADLTADKIYSLSDGSKQILNELERDVTIRYYVNESANMLPPRMRNYSKRVADFIKVLERESDGRIKFERYDPEPDSDAEVSAKMDNIMGTPLPSGLEGYMGLAFVCLDQKAVIPFLDLTREASLEYDVIKKVRDVSKLTAHKTIGVFGDAPMFGVTDMFPQWQLFDELGTYYKILQLTGDETEIDPEIDVMMIMHPLGFKPAFEKALDAYLQNGGDMIVMLDPVALSFMFYQQGYIEQNVSSIWPKLEKASNIQFSYKAAVLDMTLRTEMDRGEGMEELSFILTMTDQQMGSEHQISEQVSEISMPIVGAFFGEPTAGLKKTVLLQSSKDSAMYEARKLMDLRRLGAEKLNREFVPDDKTYDLALLLEGKLPSLFTGEVTAETKASRIILWGDSDFVSDPISGQTVNVQGREIFYPRNNNISIVMNAVDYLCDSFELNAARSKTRASRPLTKLIELERTAEKKYSNRIQELDDTAFQLEQELTKSRMITSGDEKGTLRDLSTQARIDELEKKYYTSKNEMRLLRKNLRHEIQAIRNRVIIFNGVLVPLIWSVFGLIILVRRHYKTRPRAVADE